MLSGIFSGMRKCFFSPKNVISALLCSYLGWCQLAGISQQLQAAWYSMRWYPSLLFLVKLRPKLFAYIIDSFLCHYKLRPKTS